MLFFVRNNIYDASILSSNQISIILYRYNKGKNEFRKRAQLGHSFQDVSQSIYNLKIKDKLFIFVIPLITIHFQFILNI